MIRKATNVTRRKTSMESPLREPHPCCRGGWVRGRSAGGQRQDGTRPVTDPQALFPKTSAHCRPKVIPSQEWNFSRRHPLQTPIQASLPVLKCLCVARIAGPLWDALICRELEVCLPGEIYLQAPHLKPCFAKGKNCGIEKLWAHLLLLSILSKASCLPKDLHLKWKTFSEN